MLISLRLNLFGSWNSKLFSESSLRINYKKKCRWTLGRSGGRRLDSGWTDEHRLAVGRCRFTTFEGSFSSLFLCCVFRLWPCTCWAEHFVSGWEKIKKTFFSIVCHLRAIFWSGEREEDEVEEGGRCTHNLSYQQTSGFIPPRNRPETQLTWPSRLLPFDLAKEPWKNLLLLLLEPKKKFIHKENQLIVQCNFHDR